MFLRLEIIQFSGNRENIRDWEKNYNILWMIYDDFNFVQDHIRIETRIDTRNLP